MRVVGIPEMLMVTVVVKRVMHYVVVPTACVEISVSKYAHVHVYVCSFGYLMP